MIHQTTHPSLLVRVRDASDDEAWAEFDGRYGELILRHCLSRGVQRADADDIRQSVLINLLSALRSFEYQPARGRFRSYLHRSVQNAIARHYGRQPRPTRALFSDEIVADPEMDERWHAQWVQQHLRVALRALRRHARPQSVEVFEAFLEGLSTTEIADRFDLSPEAVQKIKERVRVRLRALVARQIEEEERIGDDTTA